jgi:hypothetical protein
MKSFIIIQLCTRMLGFIQYFNIFSICYVFLEVINEFNIKKASIRDEIIYIYIQCVFKKKTELLL